MITLRMKNDKDAAVTEKLGRDKMERRNRRRKKRW